MKTGLEEALAECLASVERGRSIEECLARYPGLAPDLEPLLLTALGIQQALGVRPRPSFQRAALQRFLATAGGRGPRPLAVPPPPRRFSFGWRWAPVAVAAPVLAVAVALATVLAFTGGGGGGGAGAGIAVGHITPVVTPVPASTETPAPPVPQEVPRLVAQLKEIQAQVDQGGVIPREDIQELRDINQSLEQTLSEALPGAVEAAPQIADLLAQQEAVLNTAREQDQVAPEAADDMDDLISIAAAVQTRIDEMFSPTATPTPEPTVTSTPTPAPTETPSATASPTATGTPATSPTAVPSTVSSPTPGPATAAGASPTPPTPNP